MNLKFPLLNLIARGHLPLANKTASLNFAKSIDDGPATRICFEMLKFDNIKDSAMFLEEAQREFEKLNNSVSSSYSDDVKFRHQRDAILLREDSNPRQDQQIVIDPTRQFVNLFKSSGIVVAVGFLITRNPREQETILRNLKAIYPNIYKVVQNNHIGRKFLPADKGEYFKRLFNTKLLGKVKDDGSSYMTKSDITKFNKFKDKVVKNTGTGIAIAASIATAIVMISLVYKRYFSAAAKACKGLSGKTRTICMTKARIKASDAAIARAEKSLLECSSAKDEEDCIFKMKVEIRSWKKKKMAEEEKLRKLMNVNKTAFDNNDKPDDPFV